MKILIATKNPAKAREIKAFLGNSFECVSLSDFPDAREAEETGATFEENSFIKVSAAFGQFRIPALADDGGLEIDALGGEPGVKSRRWPSSAEISEGKPGREKTDEELIQMALQKLKGIPLDKRTARLRVVVAYYDGVRTISDLQSIEGHITDGRPPRCERGVPRHFLGSGI